MSRVAEIESAYADGIYSERERYYHLLDAAEESDFGPQGEGADMSSPIKTPGQRAYEAELIAWPDYHDGAPRPPWERLNDLARWSWEKNPTPRRTRQWKSTLVA
jgi:hypothetical protein